MNPIITLYKNKFIKKGWSVKSLFIIFFLLFTSSLFAQSKVSPKIQAPYLIVDETAPTPLHQVLAKAQEYLGTPYQFGNENAKRTDCSGFTQQVFGEFGVELPRSASEQSRYGKKIDVKDLQVGDLLFYRTYKKGPSHVAIYAGNGQIIHASYKAKRVQYDAFDKRYYKQRFLYAKRIVLNEVTPTEIQN